MTIFLRRKNIYIIISICLVWIITNGLICYLLYDLANYTDIKFEYPKLNIFLLSLFLNIHFLLSIILFYFTLKTLKQRRVSDNISDSDKEDDKEDDNLDNLTTQQRQIHKAWMDYQQKAPKEPGVIGVSREIEFMSSEEFAQKEDD